MLYRNSQKRYYLPHAVYFVTITTQNRFPFFEESLFCELLIEDLKLCKNLKQFKLFGFVIIPDHIHLLIQPNDKCNISEIIRSLKTNFSRDLNTIILNKNIYAGEVAPPRLHGKIILNFKKLFFQKHTSNQNRFPKFQWQKSFHDHIIRNQKDLNYHLNYIWFNHLKHKIQLSNYKYSSYNSYKDLIDSLETSMD